MVDPAEDRARRLAAVDRDGAHQRAQLSHQRGGFGVMAHHVADHERRDPGGGLERVVPVAADLSAFERGDVTREELQPRRFRHVRREQAALQRLGHRLRTPVEPGVVEHQSGPPRHLAGGRHLLLGGAAAGGGVVEADDAEGAFAAEDRQRRDDAEVEIAQRLHRGLAGQPRVEGGIVELEERAARGDHLDDDRRVRHERRPAGFGVAVERRLLRGVAVEARDVFDPAVVVEQGHHDPVGELRNQQLRQLFCGLVGVHRRAELVGHRTPGTPAARGRARPGRGSARCRWRTRCARRCLRSAPDPAPDGHLAVEPDEPDESE